MKRPSFSPAQRLETFKLFGAIVCCQARGCDNAIQISEAQIDHVQALVDGGKHEVGNFRPICSSCHRKKSAFEHSRNSKSKRLALATEVHKQVLSKVISRPQSKLRGRGFDRTKTKKFSGEVVERK